MTSQQRCSLGHELNPKDDYCCICKRYYSEVKYQTQDVIHNDAWRLLHFSRLG